MKQNRIISICLVICIIASLFSGVVVDTKVDAKTKAIALNKTKVSLYEGGKIRLKLKNCKKKVVWSSSNKKVAVVSSKGQVIAKKKGTAWIIAKSNKKTYKCKVNVKKKVNKKTTAIPSIAPTEEPTMSPTEELSISPTEEPTMSSTEEPISVPTEKPTTTPTITPEDEIKEHWHNYVETEKKFYNYEDDSPCEEITNSATQYGYIKEECTECGDTKIRYIACPDYRKMFGEEKVDHISIGKEYQIHIKSVVSECNMKDIQFSFGRNLDGKEYFDGVILTTDGKIKLTQDYDGGYQLSSSSSILICYSYVLETSNVKQSGSLWLNTDMVSNLSNLSNPSQKKRWCEKKQRKC